MSMTTDGYITEVRYVFKEGNSSSCDFKFEPAQAYRFEFSNIKYCLFTGDLSCNPIQVRMKEVEECHWEMSMHIPSEVMALVKSNKVRVRIVLDNDLQKVESIALI